MAHGIKEQPISGGSASIIPISVSAAQTLAATSGFTAGATYRIYDAAVANGAPGSLVDDGASGFVTQAISTSQLATDGSWSFVKDYHSRMRVGFKLNWDIAASYSSQDLTDFQINGVSLLSSAPHTYTPGTGNAATWANAVEADIIANVGTHGWDVFHYTYTSGDEDYGKMGDYVFFYFKKNTPGNNNGQIATITTGASTPADVIEVLNNTGSFFGDDAIRVELSASYILEFDEITRAYDSFKDVEISSTFTTTTTPANTSTIYQYPWKTSDKLTNINVFNTLIDWDECYALPDITNCVIENSVITFGQSSLQIQFNNTEIKNSLIDFSGASSPSGINLKLIGANIINNTYLGFTGACVEDSLACTIQTTTFSNVDFRMDNHFADSTSIQFKNSNLSSDKFYLDSIKSEFSTWEIIGLESIKSVFNFRTKNYPYQALLPNIFGWYKQAFFTTSDQNETLGTSHALMNGANILFDFYCGGDPTDLTNGFVCELFGSEIIDSTIVTGVSSTSDIQTSKTYLNFSRSIIKSSKISFGGIDAFSTGADAWYFTLYTITKGIVKKSTFINSNYYMDSTVLGASGNRSSFAITIAGSSIIQSEIQVEGNQIGLTSTSSIAVNIVDSIIERSSVQNSFLTVDNGSYQMEIIECGMSDSYAIMADASVDATLPGTYVARAENTSFDHSYWYMSTGNATFLAGRFTVSNSSVNNSVIGPITQSDAAGPHTYRAFMNMNYTSVNESYVKWKSTVNATGVVGISYCSINNYSPDRNDVPAGDIAENSILLTDTSDPSYTTYTVKDMTIHGSNVEMVIRYNVGGGVLAGTPVLTGNAILPKISFYEISYGQPLSWTTPGATFEIGVDKDLFTLRFTNNNVIDYLTALEPTDVRTRTTQVNELFFDSASALPAAPKQEVVFMLKGTIMKI
jgi:hypothetical protein